MRRRTAAPVLLALALGLGVAACAEDDPMDDGAAVDTGAPTVDLSDAIATAQASMPIDVPNSLVGILLEDLCAASPDVSTRVASLPVADATQTDQVLVSLDAGTGALCPGDVDPAVRDDVQAAARAAAPTTTTTAVPAAASSSGTGRASAPAATTSGIPGSSGSGSSGSGSSNGASGSNGSTNSSTGSSQVGGGNATGSGNQSSTDFGQSLSGTPTP